MHIINHLAQPLLLSGVECTNRSFQVVPKTIRADKEFEIEITLVHPGKPGNLTTLINLKTSSTNRPVINIAAVANVLPVLSATPAKLQLPPELRTGVESTIVIQNNGTRALTLTEASANVAGVKVALRELQAGRRYALVANFPAGFQVKPGQVVQLQAHAGRTATPCSAR